MLVTVNTTDILESIWRTGGIPDAVNVGLIYQGNVERVNYCLQQFWSCWS